MTEQDYFQTITQEGFAEYKDRGSRFLAYAFPIQSAEDFKGRLALLKKEHPKAVHHCLAYRLGLDGTNFRVSDDGEPSGSAGRPILGQIDSKQLTNVAVVVVRYFGGTLLGVPGLINAYKTATTLALQVVPTVQKPVTANVEIHYDYTTEHEVMRLVKQYQCEVVLNEQQLFCRMVVAVNKTRREALLHALKEIPHVQAK
jgi:uncharacterized YigZ family protein